MYISEISKSKISDHEAIWTLEVKTPILKHPVSIVNEVKVKCAGQITGKEWRQTTQTCL